MKQVSDKKSILLLGSLAESLINFRGPLLAALVARGHRVSACAPEAPELTRQALAALGVEYYSVPLARTGLNPLADTRTLLALLALLRRLRPDMLLSYTAKPVIYGSLAARLVGIEQRYAMITGLGQAFAARRLVGAAVRHLYRLALSGNRRVFFQNPDDAALFLQLGLLRQPQQAVVVNGSGIDIDRFRPPARGAPPATFLMAARLLRAKGVAEYAAAARRVKQNYPQAAFRLAGWIDPGPASITQQELDGWVREGLIDYLGKLDDVRPALAAAAIYVLPSYYPEGTPRSVLEALAMGRAVITTDRPGCRETVRHGHNGLLVPARSAQALAAAMERLINNPRQAATMGERSRELAVAKYDVNKINAVLLQAMGLDGETAV